VSWRLPQVTVGRGRANLLLDRHYTRLTPQRLENPIPGAKSPSDQQTQDRHPPCGAALGSLIVCKIQVENCRDVASGGEDQDVQKEFSFKEGKIHFQFRVDAFNAFNHTNFTGYNGTLNFNGYPNVNGIVNGPPTITATALGRNANGTFNVTGFGTATQTGPGALGYSRILQTLIRVWF
jgi:hypothetical protein